MKKELIEIELPEGLWAKFYDIFGDQAEAVIEETIQFHLERDGKRIDKIKVH